MEVLRPSLININGIIYRRNIIKEENYEEEEEFSYMGSPGRLSQYLRLVFVKSSQPKQISLFKTKLILSARLWFIMFRG